MTSTTTTPTTMTTTPTPPNNEITVQNGVTGDIKSLNYPDPYTYPTSYTHKWEIRSAGSMSAQLNSTKRIQLSIREFITEASFDQVTVVDPLTGDNIAVLSGNVNAQSFYSSGPEMDVSFTTNDNVALKGFYMTWYEMDIPTTTTKSTTILTTTIGPPTTPHERGHSNCNFDAGFCEYKQRSSTLRWQIVSSVAPGEVTTRVPSRDKTTGTGDFAFVDSSAPVSDNVAQLYTDFIIENPNSCHSVRFQYSIAGNTPGSLTLKLMTTSEDVVKDLWSSDQATNGWTEATVNFRHFAAFKLMFEARRVDSQGGSDFALDDVVIPSTGCSDAPLVPPSSDSTATESPDGLVTDIEGQSGEITSPNYPSVYPADFEHMWRIMVADNSTIKITVLSFLTEPADDRLTAKEKDNITELFSLDGVLLPPEVYMSTTNQVSLTFTTDSDRDEIGWRILWEEVSSMTTSSSATPPTTTPSSYGLDLFCTFDDNQLCQMTNDGATDLLWNFQQGSSPNSPTSGPSKDSTGNSANGYAYINSQDPTSNGDKVASLQTPPIYSFLGCYRVLFAYHAFGSNLASIALYTAATGPNAGEPVERWISDSSSSSNWRSAEVFIQMSGEFQLVWRGKRVKTEAGEFGGGDLAIDDVTVTECTSSDLTTAAPTQLPFLNGGSTILTGTSGDIISKNYPSPYPNDYSHTWDITGDESEKVVSLIVMDFNTEECCDKVVIMDPVDGSILATLSGTVEPKNIIQSPSNRMTIKFGETDNAIAATGFHFTWFLAGKPLETSTGVTDPVTTVSTTLEEVDSASAIISPTDYQSWIPILFVCVLIVILAIIACVYVRKRNAAKSKVSSSKEYLNEDPPQLREDFEGTAPATTYPRPDPYYSVPFNGIGYASRPHSQAGDSGHYSLPPYDHNNVINPLKKKSKSGYHLSENGQLANGRRKKTKKLQSFKGDKYMGRRSSNSGIVSLPDGEGNTTPVGVNSTPLSTQRDPYVENE
ncbi:MAM and LDL-receptor class A domain-containing protein 1-like [Watersipora subatra]|uniref:MAM and LDL-receptor class A domain-containing protein 1-like n=1 Tax=Watersipora subatra TaxID=2589382 RepID=UPI00355C9792